MWNFVVNPCGTSFRMAFYMGLQLSTQTEIPIQIYLSDFSIVEPLCKEERAEPTVFTHTL